MNARLKLYENVTSMAAMTSTRAIMCVHCTNSLKQQQTIDLNFPFFHRTQTVNLPSAIFHSVRPCMCDVWPFACLHGACIGSPVNISIFCSPAVHLMLMLATVRHCLQRTAHFSLARTTSHSNKKRQQSKNLPNIIALEWRACDFIYFSVWPDGKNASFTHSINVRFVAGMIAVDCRHRRIDK